VRALKANSGSPAFSAHRTGGVHAVGLGCGVEHRDHLRDGAPPRPEGPDRSLPRVVPRDPAALRACSRGLPDEDDPGGRVCDVDRLQARGGRVPVDRAGDDLLADPQQRGTRPRRRSVRGDRQLSGDDGRDATSPRRGSTRSRRGKRQVYPWG
jgi:hypothetical protein